jgi:hypothetical protein
MPHSSTILRAFVACLKSFAAPLVITPGQAFTAAAHHHRDSIQSSRWSMKQYAQVIVVTPMAIPRG